MKKQLLALSILTASFVQAQTFTQNFSSATAPGLPASWLQNNVDGLTVASAVSSYSFGTNAWVTVDLSGSSDPANAAHAKVAASTSYYTPAGISNDWLITPSFTVPANGVITWEANAPDASFQDGYLVKISTTGTTVASFSTTLLTVSAESSTWNSRSVNLNAYAGQTVRIAFINNSNDMDLLWLDNVSLIVPAANDIKLTSIAPIGQSVWGAIGSTKTISGVVTNNGYTTITAFAAKYTDGTSTLSSNFTGLNLGYGQTYAFSIATPFTIATAVESKIKVWADLVSDATHTNDTLRTSVKGYSFVPNHRVVFEEGTGTWCGWCVRGAVYMDSMKTVHPNTTSLIAVHNSSSDPMTNTIYDNGVGTLISGYPTVLCDRSVDIGDPGDMFTTYAAHINDFSLADITVTPTYNTATRVANVVVNTHFSSSFANNNATNDYRIAVVFTEDGVTGTASGYSQHNYYSSASQNIPLVGAGHNFQTEPVYVPAASMVYDFVARVILGGFTGQANSLPSTLTAGQTYTSSVFSYTVPTAYTASNMHVHALLIDANNQIVYNANTTTLTASPAGIHEADKNLSSVDMYPNPTDNATSLNVTLVDQSDVTVNVVNNVGQVVYQKAASMQVGSNILTIDTRNFASGIYNVVIATKTGSITKKLSVVK